MNATTIIIILLAAIYLNTIPSTPREPRISRAQRREEAAARQYAFARAAQLDREQAESLAKFRADNAALFEALLVNVPKPEPPPPPPPPPPSSLGERLSIGAVWLPVVIVAVGAAARLLTN